MTPDATTLHFLAAIEAAPADRVVRFALSDHLRESGQEAWADAVLATADKCPAKIWDDPIPSGVCYSFHLCKSRSENCDNIRKKVWVKLQGNVPDHHPSWKDYPTFAAAMLDLWRAWVAVNRDGVTA